ncbi:SusD-like starch-binding protein associating with outer membrane [Mucilaginibacter frigoritolerans]|uniref:SusD-like starch-binding protein associating with outer membrane n=1 Tax=Mucilaginibacter frigoritolerans TaxID=652788 RepID=A0A562TW80_9SPHI|nr:SusD/RagB family nutrient-binding outer membrane lipoprotein [Mucilaginibacter frigoritolerans]TWI97528.1 SusD-like starch-binding protein associating with outer membrane [Mucilaginibacter frigoritolerans]
MKKIFVHTYILLLLAVSFSACKKTIKNDYLNPEKVTSASISGFFTGMLNSDRVRPAYWNLRTFFFPQISVYAQTTAFYNAGQSYQPNDGYIGEYWSDFYYPAGNGSGPLGTYRTMQTAFAALSAADQDAQKVYMEAAKIVLDERAAKMVDMWGDIPFTQAGSLETTSTIKNPVFDDQKTLYYQFISDLDEAATYFGSVKLASNVQSAFNKADILNSGSLLKWQEYANSTRLRLLMRISSYDEATAKAAVTTMLSNPTSYPLIDGGNVGSYSPANTDILLQALTTTTSSTLSSALTEIDSYWAPDYKLNTVMLPANDPRIPVTFNKNGNATYKAMPVTYGSALQDTAFNNYSVVDSTTFLNNIKCPGIVITASEVNFLKAEAYERWSLGNAADAYNTALTQSVYFYFYLNNLGGGSTSPSATDIATFLANSNVVYAGTTQQKLALIYTQKWVHFGFLQSDEAWAELRRTKYPALTFPKQTLSTLYQYPPTRLPYPSVETSYNTNYSAVKSKDTPTTKLFWDVN